MANYSILVGCPTGDSIASLEDSLTSLDFYTRPIVDGWGPLLTGRHCLPLFWMAGFARSDLVQLSVQAVDLQGAESVVTFTGACSTSREFIDRIRDRGPRLLSIFPEALARCYSTLVDEWIDYIRRNFRNSIALSPHEIPFMVGAEFDTLFEEAIVAISRFGAAPGVTLDPRGRLGLLPDLRPGSIDAGADMARVGLFGYCDVDGAYWPPEASPAEIEYFGR